MDPPGKSQQAAAEPPQRQWWHYHFELAAACLPSTIQSFPLLRRQEGLGARLRIILILLGIAMIFSNIILLPDMASGTNSSLVRNLIDLPQLQPQASTSGSISTFPYGGSRIPKTLIFVDTRYHNMTQFPRLVQENIQNTMKVYSSHWNKANISVWFLGDEQCQQVIGKQNSDLLHFYQTESFGPFKSDICRIAALNERGGYYFDNDMEVVEAMSLPNATFITAINPNKNTISNTFIAATPRHVIFHEVINTMIDYYKRNRRTNEKNNVGPITLREGYEQAAKKYCGVASGIRCNTTWSIFDLSQVNLDDHKELYPTVSRRKGWGCCCNYVIHDAHLEKIYFWSRFLGAGGSCRFRGGKTADDID